MPGGRYSRLRFGDDEYHQFRGQIGEQAGGGCGGSRMRDAEARKAGASRTAVGCLFILASAPLFFWVAPGFRGLGVVAAGLVALLVLGLGVFLAGRWLVVFGRRRGSVERPGCLPLLVTRLALLSAAMILYYVVYYGAGAFLGGWNV